MVANAHFKRLSRGLKELWEEGYLTDSEITTTDIPVKIHKIILLIFSTLHKENVKTVSSLACSCKYSSKEVNSFVDFLYDGEADIEKTFPEMVKELKLDLKICDSVKMKKDSKEVLKQENVNLELKYLRDLTFEQEAARLLQNGCLGPDITLRTGKKLHKCHKVILASMSSYFKGMFASGMMESDTDIISLEGIDSHIFSLLLQYIYSGNIKITVSNAQELLSTSVYLQICHLQTLCEEFLMNHLDLSNCVDVWNLGKLYDCNVLSSGAWKYIIDNFADISLPKLADLPRNDVISLVKDDNLNTSNEKDVFKFILHWTSKSAEREKNCSEILHHIRFSLISRMYVEEILSQHKLFRTNKACSDLVKMAVEDPDTNEKPRKEKIFLVLKGSAFDTKLEVACYSIQQCKWFSLQSMKALCGTAFAACVSSSGKDLYLTGGSAHPQSCHHFSLDENRWTAKADMNEGRSSHGIGFVNDKVYVLGGFSAYVDFDLNGSIEKYDIETDTWKVVARLQIPTYDSASAVVKSRIYMFGGTMSVIPGSYIKDIQCFDTVTETCTIVYHNLPMPLSLGVAVACSHNRDIYIVCPRGDIIHYSEDIPPTVIHPVSGRGYMGFGVACHDNRLYIMGGYNYTTSDCIKYFDIKSRKFSLVPKLKLPFEKNCHHLFATTANISRRHLEHEYR